MRGVLEEGREEGGKKGRNEEGREGGEGKITSKSEWKASSRKLLSGRREGKDAWRGGVAKSIFIIPQHSTLPLRIPLKDARLRMLHL